MKKKNKLLDKIEINSGAIVDVIITTLYDKPNATWRELSEAIADSKDYVLDVVTVKCRTYGLTSGRIK